MKVETIRKMECEFLTELYERTGDQLGNAYERDGIVYIDYGKCCFGQFSLLQQLNTKYGIGLIEHRPAFLEEVLPAGRLVITST